ncbi:MAG: hypothetical protein AAFO94_15745, partial [Bacteroidota bacterium]
MKNLLLLLALVSTIWSCKSDEAKNESAPPALLSNTLFFQSEEAIPVTLKTDFSRLLSEDTDDDYQQAWLSVPAKDGTIITEAIKVRKRGVTRKKICDFPPLKLKFNDPQSSLNLKLVTHCQQDEEMQKLILKEYLVYKMYNELTDYSFRVQLIKVIYEDLAEELPKMEKYAFVIENAEQMANRLEASVLETPIQVKYLEKDQCRLFTGFQYLIGNTDWNLGKRHNLKMLTPDGDGNPLPVPYDFDYCGLVDAPYAIPHPSLPIQSVRERHFMWRGKDRKGFETVLQTLQEKKRSLLEVCENFPYLNSDDRQ